MTQQAKSADKRFSKPQLHVLYRALDDAADWQNALADSCNVPGIECQIQRKKAQNQELVYRNMREQIGRFLRGER